MGNLALIFRSCFTLLLLDYEQVSVCVTMCVCVRVCVRVWTCVVYYCLVSVLVLFLIESTQNFWIIHIIASCSPPAKLDTA